ncbi:MAG: hypothetical protein ACREFE_03435 [Limisphaerales bacterium]
MDFTAPNPNGKGWTRARWLMLIAIIFTAHVALIFIFGERKPKPPRTVEKVPTLQLANRASELQALNDPILFALPNPKDFASVVWLKAPQVKPSSFVWTEPPRWLQLPADKLAVAFGQFMRTNYFAGVPLQFKPPPRLNEPILPIDPALAQISTLQITGNLAQRRLLNKINLPSPPYNDVIAPSKVQVLVDEAGNVISEVLLPPENNFEAARDPAADQRALELARAARFAPAPNLTVGVLIFNWQTVPPKTSANEHP